jgi:hypothetical protein
MRPEVPFEAVEAVLPLPLPLLLGALTLTASVLTALITYIWSKKVRTPADNREDRRLDIEADEKLLQRFEDMLASRDKQIKELGAKVEELDNRLEGYRQERNVLLDFIYALIRIIRDLGGINLIPRPPSGVRISGHPSANTHVEETPPGGRP